MKLKELRAFESKTSEEVAKYLDISVQAYYKYESGKSEPNIANLKKLADLYNVSLDYLVGRQFHYEFEYLTEQQKAVVKLICQLNENNLLRVASYISGMLAIQD